MSLKRKPPVWQLPVLIASGLTALGILGKGVISLSSYLTLTDRVEAEVAKNAEQDKTLDRLATIQEQNQKLMTQQQSIFELLAQQVAPAAAPTPPPVLPLKEYDGTTGILWCCPSSDREACYRQQAWYVCP